MNPLTPKKWELGSSSIPLLFRHEVVKARLDTEPRAFFLFFSFLFFSFHEVLRLEETRPPHATPAFKEFCFPSDDQQN